MNNYLNRMYNSKPNSAPADNGKNPNRVAGGLRAQGHDTYAMLGEDGIERKIPSQQYVNALEDKVRNLQEQTKTLDRKLTRQASDIQQLGTLVNRITKQG